MLKIAGNLVLAMLYIELFLRLLEEKHLYGIVYT